MPAIATIVGGIGGALINKDSTDDAIAAQTQASDKGLAALKDIDTKNRASLGKYSGNVAPALDRRRALLGLGSEQDQINAENRMYSGQAYEAGVDRVVDNVNRRSSVNGGIYGGNRLAEFANRLKQFDYATQGNYLNQLGSEVGIGLSADSAAAGVSQSNAVGQANLMNTAANNIAGYNMAGGASMGAGFADVMAGVSRLPVFNNKGTGTGWQGTPQVQGGYYA